MSRIVPPGVVRRILGPRPVDTAQPIQNGAHPATLDQLSVQVIAPSPLVAEETAPLWQPGERLAQRALHDERPGLVQQCERVGDSPARVTGASRPG